MNLFSDMHTHVLCGVDDGAKDEETMYRMLDAAYADGTRILCATPHYHPGYYGENRAKAEKAFEKLTAYAAGKYPDLRLSAGNELHFSPDCVSWIRSGQCRTLNGSDFIMIDFDFSETEKVMVRAINSIMNTGYRPIFAHAERYDALTLDSVAAMHRDGVVVQLDTQSVLGQLGHGAKQRSKKMLKRFIADLVSSDCHDTGSRPPQMRACFEYLAKKYDADYADWLCRVNAERLLYSNDPDREDDQ